MIRITCLLVARAERALLLRRPYLVLPASSAHAWRGAEDEAAYGAVSRGPDEGRVITLAGVDALVLGTPDSLYFAETEAGGLFVRVVSFDAADDDVLAEHAAHVPDDAWEPLGSLRLAEGGLLAFDAAIAGDDARNDGLVINLAAGTYALSTRTYQPDDGTELMLTRLVRA